jgi:hypothetical protein
LELLVSFSFFMQPCLDDMVGEKHVKQEPKQLLDGTGKLFALLSRRLPLFMPTGLTSSTAAEVWDHLLEGRTPELEGLEASWWV